MAEEEYKALTERLARIESLVMSGTKEVLTIDECSAYTGYSKNHLYRLTSQRAIPFYKPMGGTIYFRKSEIEDWLLRNRQATEAEINSQATTYCRTHK
jgi:excisionase family DNA binding protein